MSDLWRDFKEENGGIKRLREYARTRESSVGGTRARRRALSVPSPLVPSDVPLRLERTATASKAAAEETMDFCVSRDSNLRRVAHVKATIRSALLHSSSVKIFRSFNISKNNIAREQAGDIRSVLETKALYIPSSACRSIR